MTQLESEGTVTAELGVQQLVFKDDPETLRQMQEVADRLNETISEMRLSQRKAWAKRGIFFY